MPNKKTPTKNLIKPKYFAPITPNEDRNRTTKGSPCFRDGFPIQFEKR